MIILLAILASFTGGGYLFMQQKQFGAEPKGERLTRILNSPNYRDGSFQNLTPTPMLAEGVTYWTVMKDYLSKAEGREPQESIPTLTTNLKQLSDSIPSIVWFGHSSYLIKINGKHILVDPVFSGSASPVSFFGKNFKGSNMYDVDAFPDIDVVLITHDHYDHLDYQTIQKLIPKTKNFCTSLGVGAHLEYWGVPSSKITELDWWECARLDSDMVFTAAPARHFSGRKFTRGKTLWSSFIFESNDYKLFLGGDSGYEKHFKEIGSKFGGFDLAILECGQYNTSWRNIHMMPEETVQASIDLKAEKLLPVHWSKFTLAQHAWDDSIRRVTAEAKQKNVSILHPMIGEILSIKESHAFSPWWENVN
jgi:L-ascorbate metabolism protein UlaG (beta-lactamase superfamily)